MGDDTITLLGIVGSVSANSKTRSAVEVALDAAAKTGSEDANKSVKTEVLHLAEYDLDTADGRKLDQYEGDTAAALEVIVDADAYIVGTPVYRGSYSGALKNLLDMVPRGMWQGDAAPFENAAVGLVATGATDHHFLAVDQELRPVFAFFGAHTVGGAVYANDDDFDDDRAVAGDVRDRLATLGEATVELHAAVSESEALAELGPQF